MAHKFDQYDDIIDVRDVIERFGELGEALAIAAATSKEAVSQFNASGEGEEYTKLQALLDELIDCGGGDIQWRGDWYPSTLIRDSYFTEYTQELLEEFGVLPKDLPHYITIDWEATSRNIRVDYTSVEFEGVTYWTR